MATMTNGPAAGEQDLVRQQYFECDGPVDVDIELGTGSIEVRFADAAHQTDPADLTDEANTGNGQSPDAEQGEPGMDSDPTMAPAIMVEVRHKPQAGAAWGLAGLLSWVGGQLGVDTSDLAAEAVRQTFISEHGNRLSVRGPRTLPLHRVPLAILVHAPADSALRVKAGSASVQVGGPAGRVHIDAGSGRVTVDHAAGPVQVRSGSGSVRLGPMPDSLQARTGSGDMEVTSLEGGAVLHSGSGDIWIGTVRGHDAGDEVTVRTGSGDLTVAEATRGMLKLVTGSGDLRVGIGSGVLAEVDVTSGAGRIRSDLPVSNRPPSGRAEATLRVRARTGSGHTVVSHATA